MYTDVTKALKSDKLCAGRENQWNQGDSDGQSIDLSRFWVDMASNWQSLPVSSNITETQPAKTWLSINCKKASAVSCDNLAMLGLWCRRDKNTKWRLERSRRCTLVQSVIVCLPPGCVSRTEPPAGACETQSSPSAPGQQLLQHQNRPLLSTPVICVLQFV